MVNLELDHGGLIWVVEDVDDPTLPLLASTDKLARLLEKPIPTQPKRHMEDGETAEPDASDSYNDALEVPQTPAQKLKSATSKLLGLMRSSPGKSAKENFLDLVGGDASDSDEDQDKERLMDSKIELSETPPSPTKKFQSATSKLIGLMRSSPEKSAKENFRDLVGDNPSDSEEEEIPSYIGKEKLAEAPPSPSKKLKSATSKLLGLMRSNPGKTAKQSFEQLMNDSISVLELDDEDDLPKDVAETDTPKSANTEEDTGVDPKTKKYEQYQKLKRVNAMETAIEAALEDVVNLRRDILDKKRSKKKSAGDPDQKEERDDLTWIQIARFFNTMQLLTPLLLEMFRHEYRNCKHLVIGNDRLSSGEKTSGEKLAWLLSEHVYDLVDYTSRRGMFRKLANTFGRIGVPDIFEDSSDWQNVMKKIVKAFVAFSTLGNVRDARRLLRAEVSLDAEDTSNSERETVEPEQSPLDAQVPLSPRKNRNRRAAQRAKAKLQAVVTMLSLSPTRSPRQQPGKIELKDLALPMAESPEEESVEETKNEEVPANDTVCVPPQSPRRRSTNRRSRVKRVVQKVDDGTRIGKSEHESVGKAIPLHRDEDPPRSTTGRIEEGEEEGCEEDSSDRQTSTSLPPPSPKRSPMKRQSRAKKAQQRARESDNNDNVIDDGIPDFGDFALPFADDDATQKSARSSKSRRSRTSRKQNTHSTKSSRSSTNSVDLSEHTSTRAEDDTDLIPNASHSHGNNKKLEGTNVIDSSGHTSSVREEEDGRLVAETQGESKPRTRHAPLSPRRRAANRLNKRSLKMQVPACTGLNDDSIGQDDNYEEKQAQAKVLSIGALAEVNKPTYKAKKIVISTAEDCNDYDPTYKQVEEVVEVKESSRRQSRSSLRRHR